VDALGGVSNAHTPTPQKAKPKKLRIPKPKGSACRPLKKAPDLPVMSDFENTSTGVVTDSQTVTVLQAKKGASKFLEAQVFDLSEMFIKKCSVRVTKSVEKQFGSNFQRWEDGLAQHMKTLKGELNQLKHPQQPPATEQQLSDLRVHMDGRFDALTNSLQSVSDAVNSLKALVEIRVIQTETKAQNQPATRPHQVPAQMVSRPTKSLPDLSPDYRCQGDELFTMQRSHPNSSADYLGQGNQWGEFSSGSRAHVWPEEFVHSSPNEKRREIFESQLSPIRPTPSEMLQDQSTQNQLTAPIDIYTFNPGTEGYLNLV